MTQFTNRLLTTSRQSDQGDHSASRNVKIEVIEHALIWSCWVRKIYRFEVDCTGQTVIWNDLTTT